MIFLLNHERVLAEVAELARLHISGMLKVEPQVVAVQLELAPGGRIRPQFDVAVPPDAGALEKKFIQQAIAEVWLGWAKQELIDRLRGLNEVRAYVQETPEASQDSDHQKAKEKEPPIQKETVQ